MKETHSALVTRQATRSWLMKFASNKIKDFTFKLVLMALIIIAVFKNVKK